MSDKDQDDNIPDTDLEADGANEFSDLPVEEGEEGASDFYEEGEGLVGDEEFIEEDWEAYDDEFVEEETATSSKKKSKPNKLVVGGAAVAGLVVMLFMMGGGEAPAPQQASAPQTNVAAMQTGADAAADSKRTQRDLLYNRNAQERQQKKAQGGFLNNPEDLAVMDQKAEEAFESAGYYYEEEPMPAEDSQQEITIQDNREQEVQSADDLLPMPTPIQQEDDSQTQEPPPLFDEQEIAATETEEEKEEPLLFNKKAEQPAQAGDLMKDAQDQDKDEVSSFQKQKQALSSSVDSEMLASLNDKLESIVSRIDEMEDSFSAIENRMASLQTQGKETDQLAQSVKKLERKIDTVASDIRRQAKNTARSESKGGAPAREKTATAPPVPAKKSTVSDPERSASSQEERWVLKAVQPGKAWVARPGSNDMQTVKIGDMLAGIGKITAIDLIEGRWVVQGTNSKITQ